MGKPNGYVYTYCHNCHQKVKLYKAKVECLTALELVYYEYACEHCNQVVLTDTEKMLTTQELALDTSNRNAIQMKPNLWALLYY